MIAAADLQNLNNHFKAEEYPAEKKHVVSYTRVGEAEPFFAAFGGYNTAKAV